MTWQEMLELNMLVAVHILGWEWRRAKDPSRDGKCALFMPARSDYERNVELVHWELLNTVPAPHERMYQWWNGSGHALMAGRVQNLPNFCKDLSACWEMEQAIENQRWASWGQFDFYTQAMIGLLSEVPNSGIEFALLHATPSQKVEAALRAYGVWPEKGEQP